MVTRQSDPFGIRILIAVVCFIATIQFSLGQERARNSSALDASIKKAFDSSSDGWSVDEVLLHDDRRNSFIEACRSLPGISSDISDKQLFERLIQIRKAGKLGAQSTQRSHSDVDAWLPVAEIASRRMMDEYQANVDQWLVDPDLLVKFDHIASQIVADADRYEVRKAALKLRKSRRLKPELMSRVTDWKRDIKTFTVEEASSDLSQIPTNAGVYIFRDKTGYLYIGQSNNLRTRLTKHLDESDRKSLCNYLKSNDEKGITIELHVFAKDSPAADTVAREAYESDLIRTRKPRLNLAP